MWEASYTVGPQLYQLTLFPLDGKNSSFWRVKLLNNFKTGLFSDLVGGDQAGKVLLDIL